MRPHKNYAYVGLIMLIAFVLQAVLGIKWTWLQQLQLDKTYQFWSGLLLATFLAAQWYLSLLRVLGQGKRAKFNYKIHQQFGILAPLFFFIHSTEIGYAYLSLLSLVYLSNVLVGLLNPTYWNKQDKQFAFNWMIAHVALSVVTIMLAGFHLAMVVYYE